MKKGSLLKVSGAVTATLMLGSVVGATAYAGTTSNKTAGGTSSDHVSHASLRNSNDRSVLALIHQLQKRMNKIQRGSSNSGRTPFLHQPRIKIWPWVAGNLLPVLATDLGINKSDLLADLQSGETVAQIAAQHNVSTSKLISKLESAEASRLQAEIKRFESIADKSITRFVNGKQPKTKHPVPNFNPGGPMIPAPGPQFNPGGPMIPAPGPQFNPGGPMIPAPGSQFNPGGPMIPASTKNSTDVAAYKQLVNAANSFLYMLQTEQNNGESSVVNTDISQANAVLGNLKVSFESSMSNTQHSSGKGFTSAQLSAIHTAAQSLEKIVLDSGIRTTTQGDTPISTQSYATSSEAAKQIANLQAAKTAFSGNAPTVNLGYGVTAKEDAGMGHAGYQWQEGNWTIEILFYTENRNVKQVAENIVSYLHTHKLPVPNNHGAIVVRSTDTNSKFEAKTTIAWQEGTTVNEVQQTGNPIRALATVVSHK